MREAREVMAELAATGLSPEQAALVMELAAAVSAEARPIVDEAANRRREKDRERKRTKSGIPQNSAESAESVEPKRKSPEPPKKTTPIPPLKGGTFPKLSDQQPEKPKSLAAWVAEIWEMTPRPGRERSGRPALENSLKAAARRGSDLATVKRGVAGYYASPDATKGGGQYAQGVHVVISSGRWEAFAEDEAEPEPVEADPWRARITAWKVNGYWNSEWGPKPGKPGCLAPMEQAA